MVVSMSLYSARYIAHSFISKLWMAITVEAASGLSFAVSLAAMMEHVSEIAPKKMKATMVMVLYTVHFDVTGFLLNVVCGKVYEELGGRVLFRSIGVLCGVWTLLMVVYCFIRNIWKGRVPQLSEAERSPAHNVEEG